MQAQRIADLPGARFTGNSSRCGGHLLCDSRPHPLPPHPLHPLCVTSAILLSLATWQSESRAEIVHRASITARAPQASLVSIRMLAPQREGAQWLLVGQITTVQCAGAAKPATGQTLRVAAWTGSRHPPPEISHLTRKGGTFVAIVAANGELAGPEPLEVDATGEWLLYRIPDEYLYGWQWTSVADVWIGRPDGSDPCMAVPWRAMTQAERTAAPPVGGLRWMPNSAWRRLLAADVYSTICENKPIPPGGYGHLPGACAEGRGPCAKRLACRVAGRCSSDAAGMCAAKSDADCRRSAGCTFGGACSAVDGQCVATAADCARAAVCTELGQCQAQAGACVAATDSTCRAAKACGARGDCRREGPQCRLYDVHDCAQFGRDSGLLDLNDRPCWLPADYDCASSPVCESDRRCAKQGDRCIAGGIANCAAFTACAVQGACTARGTSCYAAGQTTAECAASKACSWAGRCAAVAGQCVALSNQSCRAAEVCPRQGACSAVAGSCRATSQNDCDLAEDCRGCKLANGVCRP